MIKDIEEYISPSLNEADFGNLQKWYFKITGADIPDRTPSASNDFFENVSWRYADLQ